MKRTSLQVVKRVLRMLKRAYPGSVVIHRRGEITLDLESGQKSFDVQAWRVNKAIILPSDAARKFSYDLAFIAVLKQFTYGAQYDVNSRRIIVDNADLPAGWKPHKDDYIVYDNLKYEIAEIQQFEFNAGIIYTLKGLPGDPTDLVIPILWRNTLHFHEGFSHD
jgi:hypothetical protein